MATTKITCYDAAGLASGGKMAQGSSTIEMVSVCLGMLRPVACDVLSVFPRHLGKVSDSSLCLQLRKDHFVASPL